MPNPTSAQERRVASAMSRYHNEMVVPLVSDLVERHGTLQARLDAQDIELLRLRLRTKPWWQRAWTALRRAA
jgi:hypothetical protein